MIRSCMRAYLCVSAVARRAWSLGIRLTSISVMGRGVFGAIPESGSASESQSQTRGTSTQSCRLADGESSCYKSRHLCAKSLTERLLTVSVANTDSDLIGCQLYSINTLNDETLGAYRI